MTKYCDIEIMVRSEECNGGSIYVKDLSIKEVTKKLKEIEQIMRDFAIANDCNIIFQDTDEYGSFVAVDVRNLGCVHVYVSNVRDSGPKSLRDQIEEILKHLFKIENPAGLLEKIEDQEIEHSMENDEWTYGHNQVSNYRHITQQELDDNLKWQDEMVEAMKEDCKKHPKNYKGGTRAMDL